MRSTDDFLEALSDKRDSERLRTLHDELKKTAKRARKVKSSEEVANMKKDVAAMMRTLRRLQKQWK